MIPSTPVIRNKPVARQVEDILRERIRQGVYPPDQRMPSEERLAEELQVSRATLRTAMASLAAEGYITRRHGDGTYVRAHAVEFSLRPVRIWDIERQIRESGRTPSLRVLEQALRFPTALEAERLGLEPRQEVFSMRRLFLADRQPLVLIANVMRPQDLRQPLPPDAASLAPLVLLEKHLQTAPRDGLVHFMAIQADAALAALFEIAPGQPLLHMDNIVFDTAGRPLIYETETYLGWEGFRMHLSIR